MVDTPVYKLKGKQGSTCSVINRDTAFTNKWEHICKYALDLHHNNLFPIDRAFSEASFLHLVPYREEMHGGGVIHWMKRRIRRSSNANAYAKHYALTLARYASAIGATEAHAQLINFIYKKKVEPIKKKSGVPPVIDVCNRTVNRFAAYKSQNHGTVQNIKEYFVASTLVKLGRTEPGIAQLMRCAYALTDRYYAAICASVFSLSQQKNHGLTDDHIVFTNVFSNSLEACKTTLNKRVKFTFVDGENLVKLTDTSNTDFFRTIGSTFVNAIFYNNPVKWRRTMSMFRQVLDKGTSKGFTFLASLLYGDLNSLNNANQCKRFVTENAEYQNTTITHLRPGTLEHQEFYAKWCYLAYQSPAIRAEKILPMGWKILEQSENMFIVTNHEIKEAILVFRGTHDLSEDLIHDLLLALNRRSKDTRFRRAISITEALLEGYPDWRISVCGHSLGSSIASYVHARINNDRLFYIGYAEHVPFSTYVIDYIQGKKRKKFEDQILSSPHYVRTWVSYTTMLDPVGWASTQVRDVFVVKQMLKNPHSLLNFVKNPEFPSKSETTYHQAI